LLSQSTVALLYFATLSNFNFESTTLTLVLLFFLRMMITEL